MTDHDLPCGLAWAAFVFVGFITWGLILLAVRWLLR